jgi:hypothetical protein
VTFIEAIFDEEIETNFENFIKSVEIRLNVTMDKTKTSDEISK